MTGTSKQKVPITGPTRNLSVAEKNRLVAQYEPLVSRLVSQFYKNVKCSWQELHSMASEGLALAIEKYDPTKSTQTFTQFAGYAIANNIKTCLDEELRVVKLSAYAQKKIKDESYMKQRAERVRDQLEMIKAKTAEAKANAKAFAQEKVVDIDDLKPRELVMGMYCDEDFSNGDVFEYLYSRIEEEFSVRDYTIFYRVFGLKGYDETPNKVIAKELHVSEGLISQRLKKVLDFIRKDTELCEALASLYHNTKQYC